MPYVFGPVPSRRLGLSLGIDLLPVKTCTYDYLYCQVGRTTQKTTEIKPFVPAEEVLEELKKSLGKNTPDIITLAGSGEPTLHSEIDRVITYIKGITDIKIALLTNGSLLWRDEIRNRIPGVHIIMPTLTTVFEETFRAIHRPHFDLHLPIIIAGVPIKRKWRPYNSLANTVLDMARRRPLRAVDLANALNIPLEEVKNLIKGLRIKGFLHQQEHSGDVFYTAGQSGVKLKRKL